MAARLIARAGVIAAGALAAAGCAQRPSAEAIVQVSHTSPADRDCLARAMYFESHRGSDDGMLAVGTVVANRVKSGQYGSSYCEVVGQKKQFADGVLSRSMDDSGAERARRAADAVMSGKRHPGVHDAMFFHTAGLRFPYPNMRYVLVAGGNAFYEKRSVATAADVRENARSRAMALAYAKADPTAAAKPIMVASLEPRPIVAATAAPTAVALAAAQRGTEPASADVAATASVTTTTGSATAMASATPTAKPAATAMPVAAPVVVARATTVPAPKAAPLQVAAATAPKAAAQVAVAPAAKSASAATVLASVAAPARKSAAAPTRTISVNAAPVLASSAPTGARRAAEKTGPASPPVVAFAPEQTQPTFPSSGGSRVASGNSPVAQAWASFQ